MKNVSIHDLETCLNLFVVKFLDVVTLKDSALKAQKLKMVVDNHIKIPYEFIKMYFDSSFIW
jgi:hypothetical protein